MYLRFISGFRFFLLWFQDWFLILNNIYNQHNCRYLEEEQKEEKQQEKKKTVTIKRQKKWQMKIAPIVNWTRDVTSTKISIDSFEYSLEKVKNCVHRRLCARRIKSYRRLCDQMSKKSQWLALTGENEDRFYTSDPSVDLVEDLRLVDTFFYNCTQI